jgi:hypothetical protein
MHAWMNRIRVQGLGNSMDDSQTAQGDGERA